VFKGRQAGRPKAGTGRQAGRPKAGTDRQAGHPKGRNRQAGRSSKRQEQAGRQVVQKAGTGRQAGHPKGRNRQAGNRYLSMAPTQCQLSDLSTSEITLFSWSELRILCKRFCGRSPKNVIYFDICITVRPTNWSTIESRCTGHVIILEVSRREKERQAS
jgi:hypothetical protein